MLFDNLFEELLIHVADQVESLNVQMNRIEGQVSQTANNKQEEVSQANNGLNQEKQLMNTIVLATLPTVSNKLIGQETYSNRHVHIMMLLETSLKKYGSQYQILNAR